MIRFSHMEIGQFASAAMCLLVATAEADYLLIHVLLFEIVPFFFFFCLFRCPTGTNDTVITSKRRSGHFLCLNYYAFL